jgi:hypothetical protein
MLLKWKQFMDKNSSNRLDQVVHWPFRFIFEIIPDMKYEKSVGIKNTLCRQQHKTAKATAVHGHTNLSMDAERT